MERRTFLQLAALPLVALPPGDVPAWMSSLDPFALASALVQKINRILSSPEAAGLARSFHPEEWTDTRRMPWTHNIPGTKDGEIVKIGFTAYELAAIYQAFVVREPSSMQRIVTNYVDPAAHVFARFFLKQRELRHLVTRPAQGHIDARWCVQGQAKLPYITCLMGQTDEGLLLCFDALLGMRPGYDPTEKPIEEVAVELA